MLVQATAADREWLERLRRDVYQELFTATFGQWDEVRHVRQFADCWARGPISIIDVDDRRVGMIQFSEGPDALEINEIQVRPEHQGRGIGGHVMRDTIARARRNGKKVLLSVALKNERALRFYQRLGFQSLARTEPHIHLVFEIGT